MKTSEPLDLENLEVTMKDNRGEEIYVTKEDAIEILQKKGILELLEFTKKLTVEIDREITITVKKVK